MYRGETKQDAKIRGMKSEGPCHQSTGGTAEAGICSKTRVKKAQGRSVSQTGRGYGQLVQQNRSSHTTNKRPGTERGQGRRKNLESASELEQREVWKKDGRKKKF